MTKKITLYGKTAEVSDQDHDRLAHFGAELGMNMLNMLQQSEALKRPDAGPAPRLRPDVDLARHRASAAQHQHNVVQQMRRQRGQFV